MLTPEETLDMIDTMIDRADMEMSDGVYWDGWADGLRALRTHILGDVKANCPVG